MTKSALASGRVAIAKQNKSMASNIYRPNPDEWDLASCRTKREIQPHDKVHLLLLMDDDVCL